ncbi:MAG: hypothetical protein AAB448_05155 [Patescibacteria group bacterium]
MAITPKDITALKESFKDTFATKEDLRAVRNDFSQRMDDQSRNFSDLMRQEIRASEKRILLGVAEMITGNIVPQLDSHERRITKLEKAHT